MKILYEFYLREDGRRKNEQTPNFFFFWFAYILHLSKYINNRLHQADSKIQKLTLLPSNYIVKPPLKFITLILSK